MELNPFLVKSQRASELWPLSRDGLHLKTFPLDSYYTTVRTLHLLVRYTSVLFYLATYAIT